MQLYYLYEIDFLGNYKREVLYTVGQIVFRT
jgi:hypothetical protein